MESNTKNYITTKKGTVMKTVMSFLVMLAILIMPIGLFAQQEKTPTPDPSEQSDQPCKHKHEMSEKHMKKCNEMMSRMKEMNARLDAKVANMDTAKGDQKVEAMASVIKEMISQRKELQEYKKKRHCMGKCCMMKHRKPGIEGEAGKGKDM